MYKEMKEKEKKKGGREANKGDRRNRIEREREKGERNKKKKIFSVFRRLNPDGPRVKVDPRITGGLRVGTNILEFCQTP